MNLIIRPGTLQDSELWAPMRLALWPEYDLTEHEADLKKWLGQKEFRGWLALADGKPVGFAEAFLRPFANGCESRPVVFLEGIWVDENYRRQGVSTKLLAAVEDWAKEQGIHEIGSDAYLDNKASHKSHLKWGFEEMERVVYFRKQL